MVIIHLGTPGRAVRTTYTVTHTTIAPSYQLTPEDTAFLCSQTHGEPKAVVGKPPTSTWRPPS